MSKTKCDICKNAGHDSNNCTESWRTFHSTVSYNYLTTNITYGLWL